MKKLRRSRIILLWAGVVAVVLTSALAWAALDGSEQQPGEGESTESANHPEPILEEADQEADSLLEATELPSEDAPPDVQATPEGTAEPKDNQGTEESPQSESTESIDEEEQEPSEPSINTTETVSEGPESTPVFELTETTEVTPDGSTAGVSCPAGTEWIPIASGDMISAYDVSRTYTFSLASESAGTLVVASDVGHPEQGCQAGPDNDSRFPCDQGQMHEEFSILLDGSQIGFVPDHGEDKTATFTFPVAAAQGDHQMEFRHSGNQSSINSVVFAAALCIALDGPESTPSDVPAETPTEGVTATPPDATSTSAPSESPEPPQATPVNTPTEVSPADTEPPPDTSQPPGSESTATPDLTPPVVVPETPEATLLPCPEVIVDDDGFPVINMRDRCPPDQISTARPPWEPVVMAAPTCPDWSVYHTNQTESWDVFRLGELLDGAQGPENLTRGDGAEVFDVAPSLSPDAHWIAFTSTRTGNWELFLSNVYADDIRQITYNTTAIDLDPMWSPIGNHIVYESNRSGNWDLYLFDVGTGSERQLTDSDGNDVNAFWSYDGTRIVFQSDRDGFWQLYEIDIDGTDERRLSDGVGDDHSPAYSRDDSMIAFRSFRDGDNGVVYVMNADGTNLRRVSDPSGYAQNHVWSPDSSLIAYDSNLDGDDDLYVYDVATDQTRHFTDNAIADYAPTWYCEGPTLIFTSEVEGDSNIYEASVLPIDAPPIDVAQQASQLTTLTTADQYPERSPNEENASRQEQFPSAVKNR